jgi:hypothetical protein
MISGFDVICFSFCVLVDKYNIEGEACPLSRSKNLQTNEFVKVSKFGQKKTWIKEVKLVQNYVIYIDLYFLCASSTS